ncbi:B3 domain-containing transcription factor VRN1-like [Silene latifolia]|uniref:B3 domain-containing transcription factor VRN1-like n=1 Tax=Silene latifolia TaxID=37657 RepID=UPI003D76A7A4
MSWPFLDVHLRRNVAIQCAYFRHHMTTCEIEYPLDPQQPREVQKRVNVTKTRANHSAPNSSSQENGMLGLVRQYRRKVGVVTRKDIKKINSYQFENPSFTVIMHPSYVTDTGNKFRVRIPSKIAAEYFTNAQGTGTLQNASGDTWPIRYNGSSPKLLKFSCGWKEFALDNKLCVDDICVFELINAVECLFKVEIIRHSSLPSSVGVAGPSTSTTSPEVKREVILIDD